MWGFGTSQPEAVTRQEGSTFLGKNVIFKGLLTFDGNIQVDGWVEGELRSTGTLTVGEHAVIRGNIMAGTLITSGKINGTVMASERIMIRKPGIMIGNIRTPTISVETGARFHGLSDMGSVICIEDQHTADREILDLTVHRKRPGA